MSSIVWAVMVLLLVIGLPIGFALMAISIVLLGISGVTTPFAIAQKTVTSLSSFTMLAIPFFMLAGEAMSKTGVSKKIFDFAGSLVRHLPGGMAHVNVLTSVFLAGCSGSAAEAASRASQSSRSRSYMSIWPLTRGSPGAAFTF